MKLEDQVCSLELAKRLKELGVKQESYFYWWNGYAGYGYDAEKNWNQKPIEKTEIGFQALDRKLSWDKDCSAFTVAELGEILKDYGLPVFHGGYWDYRMNGTDRIATAPTEADARAAMVCYLIEKGLLDAKKIG